MKNFYFLIFLFLFACSSDDDTNGMVDEEPPTETAKLVNRYHNNDIEISFAYNENNQRIELVSTEDEDMLTTTYTYNDNDELASFITSYSGGEETCILQSYSATQAVYQCQDISFDPSTVSNSIRTYEFDGTLLKRFSSEDSGNIGSFQITYEHDEQGRIVSRTNTSFDNNGNITSERTLGYSNWDENRVASNAGFVFDNDLFPGFIFTTSNPQTVTFSSGNTSDLVYEYDADDYVISVTEASVSFLNVEYIE